MKRRDLIRLLEQRNCFLRREGGNHSIYQNTENGKQTAVPRHAEVDDLLVKKILAQLGIERP